MTTSPNLVGLHRKIKDYSISSSGECALCLKTFNNGMQQDVHIIDIARARARLYRSVSNHKAIYESYANYLNSVPKNQQTIAKVCTFCAQFIPSLNNFAAKQQGKEMIRHLLIKNQKKGTDMETTSIILQHQLTHKSKQLVLNDKNMRIHKTPNELKRVLSVQRDEVSTALVTSNLKYKEQETSKAILSIAREKSKSLSNYIKQRIALKKEKQLNDLGVSLVLGNKSSIPTPKKEQKQWTQSKIVSKRIGRIQRTELILSSSIKTIHSS